jgi:hypothetical protein
MLGIEIDESQIAVPLSVLSQYDYPARNGIDFWGYRRLPSSRPMVDPSLPLPDSGSVMWLLDPEHARTNAGLSSCR